MAIQYYGISIESCRISSSVLFNLGDVVVTGEDIVDSAVDGSAVVTVVDDLVVTSVESEGVDTVVEAGLHVLQVATASMVSLFASLQTPLAVTMQDKGWFIL